ncbi:MAG: phage portal protein [Tepidisphaeraceae bacterium]
MPLPLDTLQLDHPDLADHGSTLQRRVERLLTVEGPRYQRLWDYYRNPVLPQNGNVEDFGSVRPYRQAQEWGLPARITGLRSRASGFGPDVADGVSRKEVVIENDIGWRIDAMVDAIFGRAITIRSTASDAERRTTLERLLRTIISKNGGLAFLQKLALLGAVHGFVDVLVKYVAPHDDIESVDAGSATPPDQLDASQLGPQTRIGTHDDAWFERVASTIRFEIVEPARALPLLCSVDGAVATGYGQVYLVPRRSRPSDARRTRSWSRFFGLDRSMQIEADHVVVIELITPQGWQRYEDWRLIAEGANSLGRLPLVHIQNVAIPFEYAGASDVEPLMPLQDELNTRLSDRAYRITMQSFKMYLGKGIDEFVNLPVAPGRMWSTDNLGAEVVEFGGDSACPSEDSHIADIREALDKTSGVSPVAAGAIRDRIGNLTSAAALRVTMQALIARTARRRTTYGPALAQLCELALAWLDLAGVLKTTPVERGIDIDWPDALGIDTPETAPAA